jgi:hypothetical protein
MSMPGRISRRLAAAIAAGCASLALASAAAAVDLRDWSVKLPTSERFVVLSQFNNQAVLDRETQLVWQRAPVPVPATGWYDAMFRCRATSIGGRRGWRLPSFHELTSLADPSTALGALALPAGHPFQSVPVGEYWTATRTPPYQDGSFGAHTVRLDVSGHSNQRSVTAETYYGWCVRGVLPSSE